MRRKTIVLEILNLLNLQQMDSMQLKVSKLSLLINDELQQPFKSYLEPTLN